MNIKHVPDYFRTPLHSSAFVWIYWKTFTATDGQQKGDRVKQRSESEARATRETKRKAKANRKSYTFTPPFTFFLPYSLKKVHSRASVCTGEVRDQARVCEKVRMCMWVCVGVEPSWCSQHAQEEEQEYIFRGSRMVRSIFHKVHTDSQLFFLMIYV